MGERWLHLMLKVALSRYTRLLGSLTAKLRARLGLSFFGAVLPLSRSGRTPWLALAVSTGIRQQPPGLDILPLFPSPPFFRFRLLPVSLCSCLADPSRCPLVLPCRCLHRASLDILVWIYPGLRRLGLSSSGRLPALTDAGDTQETALSTHGYRGIFWLAFRWHGSATFVDV